LSRKTSEKRSWEHAPAAKEKRKPTMPRNRVILRDNLCGSVTEKNIRFPCPVKMCCPASLKKSLYGLPPIPFKSPEEASDACITKYN
jgi:hypothetical protein